DYALIGDRIACALVSLHGSIDWACFPRMDSPSVFARILDWGKGGHFQVAPTAPFTSSRRYLDDTPVLETTFLTESGTVLLTDFMPAEFITLERPADSAIVRIVRCTVGEVSLSVKLQPRFNYARSDSTWSVNDEVGVRATNYGESITLYSPLAFTVEGPTAEAELLLRAGEEHTLIMTYRRPSSMFWRSDLVARVPAILAETIQHWRAWIGRCSYSGPHQDLVRRSAITLRLLDYAPTGAMVAAPTTSLPEWIGNDRNWDYRFSWLRDTVYAVYAFYVLGYPEEGETFLGWVFDMTRSEPADLRVLYGIGGERETVEFELSHLEGYRGSRPVRVGNAAGLQKQLDMYGDLVDCAYLLVSRGGSISPELWALLRNVVDYVCEVWTEPDYGVWEVRSAPRHFTYSRGLCWVALDRGLRIAERYGFEADLERWRMVAEEIRWSLFEEGYDANRGAFTQAIGYTDLDAAVLAFPLRGILSATDPRFVSTVDRIVEELSVDGLLRRVSPTFEDGVGGGEGAFLLCSFWLVDAYALMGRLDEARALFDRLIAYRNDVGLFAEMVNPRTGELLGNFPQALTHIAAISAATNLASAEASAAAPAGSRAP
ncbi:MAG: glycoside hydrolase family 15 protein, partial [Dehalococcoidia bacterium]